MREDSEQLAFERRFFSEILTKDPENVDCLKALAHDCTLAGHYEEGLHLDLRLSTLCPEDPVVTYNLACSYSLTRQEDKALETLSRAMKQGYSDFEHMLADPDLDAVRGTKGFERLLGGGGAC